MSSKPASSQKEMSTPAVKTRPWEKIFQRDSPARFTKSKIFRESTGSTQGMRLRMRPPTKARPSMSISFAKPDCAGPVAAAAVMEMAAAGGGVAIRTKVESTARAENFQAEEGRGRAARAAANRAALAGSAGGNAEVAAAGSIRESSALPGRQISLQTTHLALALSLTMP